MTLFLRTATVLIAMLVSALARASEADCLDAVRGLATDADRTCSDLIAQLSYTEAVTPHDRQVLASAYNNRALARMAADDLEGAAADLGEAISLTPENWAILLNRGNLHLASGNPQAALQDYERVQAAAPEQAWAVRRNSILAWQAMGNPIAAAGLLRSGSVQYEAPDRPRQ